MWTNAIPATNCIIKATNNSSGLCAISSCLSTISRNKSGCNASYVTFVGYRKNSLFWVKGYATVSTLIFWHVLSLDNLWTTVVEQFNEWTRLLTQDEVVYLMRLKTWPGFVIPIVSLGQYFPSSYFFLKWSQPLALGTDEVNMFTMAGWT